MELDAQWALLARERGYTMLTRTIRYIEDRRVEEARYTGAIETAPVAGRASCGVSSTRWRSHEMALKLKAARPDASLTTLDGVGHYPMIEDPPRFAAAVAAAIADR